MSRIAHVFFEVSMSNDHDGLGKIMRKEIKSDVPERGTVAIFVNKAWTAVKLMTPDGTVLHKKPKNGVNPKTLPYLPHCVEGGRELNYQHALEKALRQEFYGARPKLAEELYSD